MGYLSFTWVYDFKIFRLSMADYQTSKIGHLSFTSV